MITSMKALYISGLDFLGSTKREVTSYNQGEVVGSFKLTDFKA
jgi:hypothetical protein